MKHVQRFESFTGIAPINEKKDVDVKKLDKELCKAVDCDKAQDALMKGDKKALKDMLTSESVSINESQVVNEMVGTGLAIVAALGGTAAFVELAKKAPEGSVARKIADQLGWLGKSAADVAGKSE